MTAVTLKVLLERQAGDIKPVVTDIKELGQTEIYPLSFRERQGYLEDLDKLKAGELTDEDLFGKWIWRIMAGPGSEPEADEIERLKDIVTAGIEESLLSQALYYQSVDAALGK